MGKEFIWMFHSLQYHRKELLSSFQFNGHTLWDLIQNHTGAPLNNSSSNQPIVSMNSNAIFIATYLQFKKITASIRKETLNTLKKISKFAQQILGLFSSGLETFKDLRSEREVFREHSMN